MSEVKRKIFLLPSGDLSLFLQQHQQLHVLLAYIDFFSSG